MEYKNPLTVSLERSFIAGTGDLAAFHNRLNKLDCAVIFILSQRLGTNYYRPPEI